jgi:hypothetical protein
VLGDAGTGGGGGSGGGGNGGGGGGSGGGGGGGGGDKGDGGGGEHSGGDTGAGNGEYDGVGEGAWVDGESEGGRGEGEVDGERCSGGTPMAMRHSGATMMTVAPAQSSARPAWRRPRSGGLCMPPTPTTSLWSTSSSRSDREATIAKLMNVHDRRRAKNGPLIATDGDDAPSKRL